MKSRLIFAIARTEDYKPGKIDLLTPTGERRIADLCDQLMKIENLGEIRILSEGVCTLTTLCAEKLSKLIGHPTATVPFSGYRGIEVELEDSDSENIDTSIFYITYSGNAHEFLVLGKWNDRRALYGFRKKIVVPPNEGRALALCIDFDTRTPYWIMESQVVSTELETAAN